MKLFRGVILFLSILSFPALAGGLFGDVEKSIGKIVSDPAIDKAVRDQAKEVAKAVKDVSHTIERAALVQKVTENALADRVKALELRVSQQSEVIANYERLVSLLRSEIKELGGE
jgi:hypothetical protein